MSVKGKIIVEGVKVELQSKWPDFVFEAGYNLRPLADVESFITKNQHLPEIPSSNNVAEERS
jgi:hypothetical protein